MTFSTKTRYGASETYDATEAATVVERLLVELETEEFEEPDDEHTQVAVGFGDWALTVQVSGLLWLEDLRGNTDAVHLRATSRTQVKDLLIAMAEGRVDEVRRAGWVPFDRLPPHREDFFRRI